MFKSATLYNTPLFSPRSLKPVFNQPAAKTSLRMTKMNSHPLAEEILFSADDIKVKVDEVGRQIASDYATKKPIIVGTLKGASIFMADLIRCIHPVPEGLELGFIRASSYGSGTSSSGNVILSISTLSDADIEGRHILLVEDIVDSGRTASELTSHFKSKGAASVRMASLLSKPARREVEYNPDYLCFEIPDKFVVGYGLDFDEQYRTWPFVGVLRPEAYRSEASE